MHADQADAEVALKMELHAELERHASTPLPAITSIYDLTFAHETIVEVLTGLWKMEGL